VVPLGCWDEADYRRSRRRAFAVLNADPHATSCLTTSMTDPRNSNFLVCWPMYRSGEDVFVDHVHGVGQGILQGVAAGATAAAYWCIG
jgi:CdiI N-terminal domain